MKLENNWRSRTLEALEKKKWQSPEFDSLLVKRAHELRKKVLSNFTIEDLRLMIGQQIGLDYLIPLSLEVLNKNLFAEGNFYEGDLLQNVMNINSDFWRDNKQYWVDVHSLIEQHKEELLVRKITTKDFDQNGNHLFKQFS